MSKTLSVVLPVHNAESTLRDDVADVLEVASELAGELRLFIVDDGSIDDTYDVAIELAARYPQLRVLRHPQRQGLGPALEALRPHVANDFVLVHDGDSRIDANQIRQIWVDEQNCKTTADNDPVSVDDLRRAASTHGAMELAHKRLAGFRHLTVGTEEQVDLSRRDQQQQAGVGVIPPLPRPNFIGSLADFALGE